MNRSLLILSLGLFALSPRAFAEKNVVVPSRARITIAALNPAPLPDCKLTGGGFDGNGCVNILMSSTTPPVFILSATLGASLSHKGLPATPFNVPTVPLPLPFTYYYCPGTIATNQGMPTLLKAKFSASVSGPGGTGTCTLPAIVTPPPSCSLSASPNPILPVQQSYWNIEGFDTGSAGYYTNSTLYYSPGVPGLVTQAFISGIGAVPAGGGQFSVGPGTYYGYVTGPGGGDMVNPACAVVIGTACQNQPTECGTDDVGGKIQGGSGCCWAMANFPLCYYMCGGDDGLMVRCPVPGCLAPETLITMSDGSEKRADRVRSGDLLWSPIRKKPVKVVKRVVGPEKIPLVELVYTESGKASRRLQATTKHPMLTRRGILPASDVKPGDFLLGGDEAFHEVIRVRSLPVDPHQMVFNFLLDSRSLSEDDHMIVAGGVVTGDFDSQSRLEKKRLH